MYAKNLNLKFNGLDFSELLENIYDREFAIYQYETLLLEAVVTGDASKLTAFMHDEAEYQSAVLKGAIA